MCDSYLAGKESSAISLLKQAVEYDTVKRYSDAVGCYTEGIQILIDVCKATKDEQKKIKYRAKINEYMIRAEELKEISKKEKEEEKSHEQIHIQENSTGYTYERLFGRCLDDQLTVIEVEDPYIRQAHQLYNFLRFCELVVKYAKNAREIKLTTMLDPNFNKQTAQRKALEELSASLSNRGITLQVEFSNSLHDREIKFNNGWIVQIGRGLDIYKSLESKFSIGFCDHELRPCLETKVDIFHNSAVKNKPSDR